MQLSCQKAVKEMAVKKGQNLCVAELMLIIKPHILCEIEVLKIEFFYQV